MRALILSSSIAVAIAALIAACGSEVTQNEAAAANGATASSTTSSSVVTSSSAATGGAGGAGAAGGAGGVGGTGGSGIGGCPSSLQFVADGLALNPQHLTLSVQASAFIGGIDRWVFDFQWTYDDPMFDDEEQYVQMTVRLMRLGPSTEPGPTLTTWLYPQDSGNPLEYFDGNHILIGILNETKQMIPSTGFFAIQRVNNVFSGNLCFDTVTQGGMYPPNAVLVSGPFSVPVP